jgi:tetratricopeptide (TPR) repeat protein/predicted Ser/Thr protein kinase
MQFKRFLRATLGLLLVLPLSICAQTANSDAETQYQNGIKSKDLEDKILYFEKAIELQPDYLDAVYQLGVTFFQKAQYEESIQHLGRATELHGTSYKESRLYLRNAYTFRATALNEKDQAESALAYALEAVHLDENFAPAQAALGLIQFSLQNWEPALRALHQSIKLNPNQETVWSRIGDIHFRVENYPQAIVAYEHALKLNPELREAQVHLGISFKRATPQLWLSVYEKLQSVGRTEDARGMLERGLAIYPQDESLLRKKREVQWDAYYMLASEAMATGDIPAAISTLEKIDPAYRDVAAKITDLKTAMAGDTLPAVTPTAKRPTRPSPKTLAENAQPLQRNQIQREKKKETNGELRQPPLANEIPVDSIIAEILTPADSVLITNHRDVATADLAADAVNNHDVKTLPAETQAPASGSSSMHWIAAALGGLLLAGLVLLKYGDVISSRMQAWRESRARGTPSDNTIEFFKDRVASVTPIKFDPIDDAKTTGKRKRAKSNSSKPPDSMRLDDTQTILGGIKKIKRIGRYILEKEIGRGTMGLIYKAWDPKLDRTVVIKQVVFDAINSMHEVATLKDRLFREARAAGRLSHPNIVIIYDVDEEKNFSYIVMEYLQGKDLKLLLEKEIHFDVPRIINIISQICSALDYAHQMGIVHRDIKPSNIILTQNNHVKVADFGIAKLPHFGTLTQTGSIIGTPYYMSPEQIEGRRLDGRSDLFSAGVILYEMLTGTHPFPGDTLPSVVYKIVHQQPQLPTNIREDVPKTLDEVVQRALAKDPMQRYATALDFIVDLESVQGELLKNEV